MPQHLTGHSAPFDQAAYDALVARQLNERSASPQTRAIDHLARDLRGVPRHPLAESLDRATRAVGLLTDSSAFSRMPADVATLRLSDAAAPAITGRPYDRSATTLPAGTTDSLLGRILDASAVVRAGAVLIPVDDAPKAHATGNGPGDVIVFERRPSRFSVITAPQAVVVADGADAPLTAMNVLRATIDLPEQASHALHFNVTRADFRERDADALAFELSRSIALGIARLADQILLAGLVAAAPSAFTLAKAAAKGLKISELRALVGTSATGAAIGADGVLRAGGIPGELVSVIAPTIIGAYSRTGVAVENQIRVVSKRTSLHGDLEIVVYVTAQALIPDAGAVWLGA